jgi:hypothetical protein
VLHVDIDHAVMAIRFDNWGDQHDGIAADFLNEGRVFDSKAVGEFHEHFRRAGFRGVDAAVGPVDGLAFRDELLRFDIGEAAGISKTRGDFLEALEFREICFVRDSGDEHVAAFFGGADAPDFNPGAFAGEQAEIGVDVLGVIEDIGRADDVMKCGVWRGNARAERKMVDKFGAEKGFRGEFFDFLGVLRVVAERTGAGLGEAGDGEQTQEEENAGQPAHHGTPQGNTFAGQYINCLARSRNRNIAVVDDMRPFGL